MNRANINTGWPRFEFSQGVGGSTSTSLQDIKSELSASSASSEDEADGKQAHLEGDATVFKCDICSQIIPTDDAADHFLEYHVD